MSRPTNNNDVYKISKKDAKRSRGLATKILADTTDRPSALATRRAVSAKVRRR
jgi:hypothetical protein